eukprot:831840-Lingulodinium_polyedra.AAC.1
MRAPGNWRARGVRGRAVREPLRRRSVDWIALLHSARNVDSTASLRCVCFTLRNAFESTFRGRSGMRAMSWARVARVACVEHAWHELHA